MSSEVNYHYDYVEEVLKKLNVSVDLVREVDPLFPEKLCPFSIELHGGVTTCLLGHYLSRMLFSEIAKLGQECIDQVLKTKFLLVPPVPEGFPEFRIQELSVRCRLVAWIENHYFFECVDEKRDLKFHFILRVIFYGLTPVASTSCSISAAFMIAKARTQKNKG